MLFKLLLENLPKYGLRADMSALWVLTRNAQLLHPRLQRRPLHSESGGSPFGPSQDPVGGFQGLQNVRTFGGLESQQLACRRLRGDLEISKRDSQDSAGRQNDGA